MFAVLMLLTAGGPAFAAEREVTQIVLWHSMSDSAGVIMTQFEKEFNETVGAQKGIQVSFEYQGTYTDAVTKMNTVLTS